MGVGKHVQSAHRHRPVAEPHEDPQVPGAGRRIAGHHDHAPRSQGRNGFYDRPTRAPTRRIENDDVGSRYAVGIETTQLLHGSGSDLAGEQVNSRTVVEGPARITHSLLTAFQ